MLASMPSLGKSWEALIDVEGSIDGAVEVGSEWENKPIDKAGDIVGATPESHGVGNVEKRDGVDTGGSEMAWEEAIAVEAVDVEDSCGIGVNSNDCE